MSALIENFLTPRMTRLKHQTSHPSNRLAPLLKKNYLPLELPYLVRINFDILPIKNVNLQGFRKKMEASPLKYHQAWFFSLSLKYAISYLLIVCTLCQISFVKTLSEDQ